MTVHSLGRERAPARGALVVVSWFDGQFVF